MAHRSLASMKGVSPASRAGLLARTALAVASDRMGGREPPSYLEGEKELRTRIVDEIRSSLGLDRDERSSEALLAIEEVLDTEIEAIAEPADLEAAEARVVAYLGAPFFDRVELPKPSVSRKEHVARRKLLANHPLFGRLGANELDRVVEYMRVARYPPRTVLFRRGDPGANMMVVLRGRVKVATYSEDGKELVLNLFSRGEVFGEIALLDGADRTADAVALDDCELLVLERRDFVPFLRSHPDAGLRLMEVLCQKLRQTSQLLEEALFLEGPSRLAKRLVHLAAAFGKPVEDGVRIDLQLSQQQLGDMVGMGRESMNKHLRQWREADLLRVQDGRFVITDLDALQEM